MKYLLNFIIWTLYLLLLIIITVIDVILSIIWDFNFKSLKEISLYDDEFFRYNPSYGKKWEYKTYWDAIRFKRHYL